MKISTLTDVNAREANQDNQLVIPKVVMKEKILFSMVADGMGGTDAGEEASKIAKECLEEWFDSNIAGLVSKASPLTAIKSSLMGALNKANELIVDFGNKKGCTLGTTSALIVLYKGEYIVANIGDSRVYKFGNRSPIQITKDQTLAQREVDAGNLTPEEAKTDKRSHTLTQCLGMDIDINPDFFKGKYKSGDYFLLCSDGMYNRVDIKDMEKIIKDKKKNTKEKLASLTILSKEQKEKDNITGILIEI